MQVVSFAQAEEDKSNVKWDKTNGIDEQVKQKELHNFAFTQLGAARGSRHAVAFQLPHDCHRTAQNDAERY